METPKLSPAKINPTKLLPGISISEKKISTQNLQEESISVLKSDLFIIKKQVLKVRDLIQTSTLIKQSELEKKRKFTEKKEAEKQENKLEAKPEEKKEGKLKMPSAPKLGFLDRIKNFLFSVLLGYISIKLLPHLPKLVGIVSIIGNVMEFMIDLGGNILDKVVTFIDWGYKAIDATRGFMKSFGGDFSLKIFDTFTGAVSGVIDAAIIAALALSAMSGGDGDGGPGGRKGGGPLKSGEQLWKEYDQKRAFIRKKHGDAAARIYDNEISNGKTPKQAFENLKNRYISKGKIVSQRQLGLGEIKGSKLFGKGIDKAPGRLVTRILGKSGKKAILGFAKPFLKRLPIIGALIDFGLSVALGEDPGRAAFKAIGAALLGAIGTAVGSLAFGFGGIIGGLLGSIGGDALGGVLYDTFFGGKGPKAQKPQAVKAAGGGPAPVTRGNKIVGGAVKRTISRKPVKRGVKVQVTKVKPGGSIGGKKKIEKIFPEVQTKDKGKNVNPLGYMQSSYDTATKTPSFGALFALPLKAQLGEKPSSVDYMKAAEELSGWMQNTFRGTAGYAGGGKVEAGMFGGDDMTNVISKSLEETISSKVDAAIKELQKQLMLKESVEEKKVSPGQEMGNDMGGGGNATEAVGGARLFMAEGFPMLAASILAGNVQAESGWNGQRTPWVLNDGAGTNKGLISWNRERIVDAEKFLGKPLEKASNGEQVRWIKEELKQYGLLNQFLDPKSTEQQLKDASYRYIGWGIEGDRWQQSSRIFAALQKGEKGSFTAGSIGAGGTLGAGYGSGGSKIAGDLGDYMKQVKIPTGEIHQHPRHPGWSKRSYRSYHNEGRAIDLGGYGPAHPSSGGKDEQAPIIKAMIEWNKKNNVTPVELIHGSPAFSRFGKYESSPNALHSHHVHVAYAKGGRVTKPTRALIGEKGPEFIFDADTTKGLDFLAPNLLEYLNAAKTKTQLMSILQSYAGYEDGAEQTVIVMNNPQMVPIPIPTGNSGSIGGMSRSSSIDTTYDIQYANA
ncbi:MAG: hypothetical protein EB120_03060 [Proteobacteria bacterium]|nr:hypothetical protein [Pseudomonadota bacterium]